MKLPLLSLAFAIALVTSVRAQTPCYADYDGPNFDNNTSMGGPWVAIKFTPPASFVATSMEVFTGEALGTNTVALWSNNAMANQPSTLLSSGSWTNGSTTNAWQGAQLSAQVPLVGGQTYWFVWIPVGGAQASIDAAPPGLGQQYTASFDNGQTWSGPFQDTTHHWKFRIFGSCSAPPAPYCTSGTTSNGCLASISASGHPDVGYVHPCQVTVANVEGQRVGIVFYGLTSLIQPWCSMGGGSSFLCVKPPTLRTGVQSSGGALGQCNGSLVLDWNAFQLAHAGALGSPWVVGEKAYVQGWFRDPASCKTTSLSNAIELIYQP